MGTSDNHDIYGLSTLWPGRRFDIVQVAVHLDDIIHCHLVALYILGHIPFERSLESWGLRCIAHQVHHWVVHTGRSARDQILGCTGSHLLRQVQHSHDSVIRFLGNACAQSAPVRHPLDIVSNLIF